MIMQSQGETMTCSRSCTSREPEALREVVIFLYLVLTHSKENMSGILLTSSYHTHCVYWWRLPKAFPSVPRFNKLGNRDYTIHYHSAYKHPLASPPANQILLEAPLPMANLGKPPDDHALLPDDIETWVHNLTSKDAEETSRLLKVARSNNLVCVETHTPLWRVTVGAVSIANLGHCLTPQVAQGQKPPL